MRLKNIILQLQAAYLQAGLGKYHVGFLTQAPADLQIATVSVFENQSEIASITNNPTKSEEHSVDDTS